MHSLRTIRDFARRHGAIWVFDAAQLSAGAAATLPAMLRHTRGSSAATVQTGTSTITSGLGTDVAGIGRALDADALGLVIEETRTNFVPYARDITSLNNAPLGGGVVTGNVGNGPDGSAVAGRANLPSGGTSRFQFPTAGIANGVIYTWSIWTRATSGTSRTQISSSTHSVGNTSITTAWGRYLVMTGAANGSGDYYIAQDARNGTANGGIAAGAIDVWLDLMHYELGKFATEAIVTSGASAARAGARLWLPYSALVTQGGRLELRLILQAKGAYTDYAASPYLWRIDANNYATISNSTGKVTIVIAGASYTTASGVTWAQGDVLDLRIGCGGGVMGTFVECSKNGAAKTSLGTTSAQAALPVNGTVDLLQDGSAANVLSCRLRKAYAYAPGTLQGVA